MLMRRWRRQLNRELKVVLLCCCDHWSTSSFHTKVTTSPGGHVNHRCVCVSLWEKNRAVLEKWQRVWDLYSVSVFLWLLGCGVSLPDDMCVFSAYSICLIVCLTLCIYVSFSCWSIQMFYVGLCVCVCVCAQMCVWQCLSLYWFPVG